MGALLHILNPLGSMLFGSIIPKVFDYFKAKQDQAHELAVMDRQIAAQAQLGAQRLEEVKVQGADASLVAAIQAGAQKAGVSWVDAYSGIIRPGVTTIMLAAYVVTKGVMLYRGQTVLEVWTESDAYFLETVVGYWFGDRSHFKTRE